MPCRNDISIVLFCKKTNFLSIFRESFDPSEADDTSKVMNEGKPIKDSLKQIESPLQNQGLEQKNISLEDNIKGIEDLEHRVSDKKILADGDDLNQIKRILQNILCAELLFDAEIDSDARLEIMVKHFELYESLYLRIRKASLIKDDFIVEDENDEIYPRYRFKCNLCFPHSITFLYYHPYQLLLFFS